jgi:hypothetical protein
VELMAGFFESLMNPASQGILNTAAGLLQASGPSLRPVSFGQALGQGFQQGSQAYQGAQHAQLEQQMADVRKRFMEAQIGAMNRPQGPDSPFGKVNPQDYTPDSLAKFSMTRNFGDLVPVARPDASLFGKIEPKDYTPESIAKFTQTRNPADLVAIPRTPLVTIGGEQQESAFQKEVGKTFGEQYSGLMKADMNAPATVGKYQRLGNLLGQVNTGKFKGTTTDLKAAAKSLGIDLAALGVADDVAPAQAARALANQIALELRNPAGGAGMPGAMSDKDREFLIQSIPSLENDPGAIGKMIEYRVKLAQREQQVAKKAREYRKRTGKFDEGFYDELQEWSNKNPLFPDQASTPKPAAAPAGFRVLGVEK